MTVSEDVLTPLALARAANRPGSRAPHTVLVLPSYSVRSSLFEHYAPRLPALEHRQLMAVLQLGRVPGARMIFVTSRHPEQSVIDYYLSLLPTEQRASVERRLVVLQVSGPGPRSVSALLLDRPDLIARIRLAVGSQPSFIDPWNVTEVERTLAERLAMPLNGMPAELWPLGFKSNGRRLMRRAGVPTPLGVEDVRGVDDVLAAVAAIRRRRPEARGVVIKTDNSGAGDGNRVIHFSGITGPAQLRRIVESEDRWFLDDLAFGGVVEELLGDVELASPSVQLDIAPGGQVEVLSTHEQILGGPNGQVYLGSRFPANPDYGPELARHGTAVGEQLAGLGGLGRFSVDFVATRPGSGCWKLHGLEMNLRRSGTSHPHSLLQSLTTGRYDASAGTWVTPVGSSCHYRSSDNVLDPAWRGRSAADAIAAVRAGGLEFDRTTTTGVVLHSLCGLDLDGGIGVTAIGTSSRHADRLYEHTLHILAGAPASTRPR